MILLFDSDGIFSFFKNHSIDVCIKGFIFFFYLLTGMWMTKKKKEYYMQIEKMVLAVSI